MMKSRFDERSCDDAKHRSRDLGSRRGDRQEQCRLCFQHWRAERVMCAYSDAAGGMYFVYLGSCGLVAIRARGVDVLELGPRWANRRLRGGGGGRCEAA